jgi:bifunctional non-homologous end joining protein LigD
MIVDGEIISANEKGAANFSQLQADLSDSRYDRMAYYAFDLLYLDGFDLRASPWSSVNGSCPACLKRPVISGR